MKKHTEDFKHETVRIALTSGLSRERVAADLGVGISTLHKWIAHYRPTMPGKGNCYDTAAVETFFKSLKVEVFWRQSGHTRQQAETAIFQYINGFYNPRRRYSSLGGIRPLAFEARVA